MTEAALTVNTALADVIRAAGCSHAGLARRVNSLGERRGLRLAYDKTAVSHWLSGTQPRPMARYLVADALSEKLNRAVTLAELGFVEPETPSCVTSSLVFQCSIEPTIDTLVGLAKMDVERRSLLKLVPFLGSALVTPQRDWLLTMLDTPAHQVAELDLSGPAAALREMSRVFDEMDNRFGGGHARVATLRYLSEHVSPLLNLSHPENQRRHLFTAAAKLAAMAGWMTYDSGDVGLAQRYMTQALRLCGEGGDHVLAGQIFAGLSHLATHAGSAREGLNLARVGVATATRAGSPLGLMRLHAMKARAHAALGEHRQASKAISDAEHALDTSRGPDYESEWVRFLDPAYLAAETAACMQEMGDHRNAVRLATRAVGGTKQLGRRHTISLTVLATAQLQQPSRDVDAAVTTATRALYGLNKISSQRSVKALNEFRRRLSPFRAERAVREFELAATARLGAA